MPLYNNILSSRKTESIASGGENVATPAAAKSSPSASMKLLQNHLIYKKLAHQKQQSQNPASKSKPAKPQHDVLYRPPHPLDTREATDNQQQQAGEPAEEEEEYDPMVPNSYEVVKAGYIKTEKRRLANLMSSSASKPGLSVPRLLDVMDNLDEDDDDNGSHEQNRSGTAIAPPPSLSHTVGPAKPSYDEVDSKPDIKRESPASATMTTVPKIKTEDPASIAAKIMSKMGYKKGQGLGRDEQGLSEHPKVENADANVGKITGPEDVKPATTGAADEKATRVLLLQNMVGPGEVDEELESETKEECGKYGPVVKCLIYEIPNKRVPDEEAVRIFVEFRHTESAIKAANDLNGRFFGGRVVRTSFYSVDKFNKYELAPSKG